MFFKNDKRKDGKIITKASKQAKTEKQNEQNQFEIDLTCPECSNVDKNLILTIEIEGHKYICNNCCCEWEIK